MTTARTAKPKSATAQARSAAQPPSTKPVRSPKPGVTAAKAAKKPAKKPVANSGTERADRLTRISSLFVGESGTDDYVIFGEHGPVLWSQYLEFQPADLALWRRMILDPSAHAGTTWQHNLRGQQLVYGFGPATEPGHVLATVPEAEAERIDPEVNPAEFTIFVGARYGKLFFVFAGSPNSFADGDFQGIYDTLRECGLLG